MILSTWPDSTDVGTHPLQIGLDGIAEPGHEIQLVRDDAFPFALVGQWAGGGALVGSEPLRVAGDDEDPFKLLDVDPETSVDHFVGGGWFGYLGFELGVPGEAPVAGPPSPERLPRFHFAHYDHLLHLDSTGQWWFEAIWTPARDSILRDRLETLRGRLPGAARSPGRFSTGPWQPDPSPQGHSIAVEACRKRIVAGDLYQANVAMRLRSVLDGHPADLFSEAAGSLQPDRAAFLAGDGFAIASLSPELFIERHGDHIRSAPIKGTRPRIDDARQAAAARVELAESSKDLAENTMIVDLVRNDLGRVCEPGSVEITTLAEPRPHPGVWHLVSEVEGTLSPEIKNSDLLASTFPPGSVTGAPKLAAMEVIAELESNARQVFTGAIGFSSPFAGLELNVAIRTFEIAGDQIWLDAGGGIVADSDPEEEAAEAATKARPLLAAIRAVREDPSPYGQAPPVTRLGPRALPRPYSGLGILETLRISNGIPVDLDHHLARLAASASELYNDDLPSTLTERIKDEAAETDGEIRLRIDFVPGGHVETTYTPINPLNEPIQLIPTTVPGGLGPHKWRDRRLLDSLSADMAPAVPLFIDLDGQILEAAWANVFVQFEDGGLATPPLDGRILPGVGREKLITECRQEGQQMEERALLLDELRRADRIFLVNSLRGSLAAEISFES